MATDRENYVNLFKSIFKDSVSFSDIKKTVPEEERSFFNMLFMSAFRQLTFIKTVVLPQFVKKKIPHKNEILNFIFYLATTELLFLDKPDYAVINSYVDIAKSKTDKFGGNFVNAVLRNILRNKTLLLEKHNQKFFSADFLKILKQDYTPIEIEEMEHFAGIEAPLDLTFKYSAHPSIDNAILLPTGSIRLPANTKITSLDDFQEGNCWAQDAASAIPVRCLGELNGKKVLDICAAPGGKTAQLLDAGATVTAVDISEKRLVKLKENIERLGLSKNLNTLCYNALDLDINEKFDVILLDAPCSATGTFRRHPEIMNTKTIEDVKKQADLQRKILKHCANLLKSNGLIVYATCSLAKAEGEKQIKTFVKECPDFCVVPIKLKGTEKMQTKEGFLRILPQYLREFSGIDGFFVAVLKRKI